MSGVLALAVRLGHAGGDKDGDELSALGSCVEYVSNAR